MCRQITEQTLGPLSYLEAEDRTPVRDGHAKRRVATLFPYLRPFIKGPCSRRNPIFETGEGFQTLVAPSGLSRVSFTWNNVATGSSRAMEAIGGLLGVTQDEGTMALRPKVGWAVRPADRLDTLLGRLAMEHKTFDGAESNVAEDGQWPFRTGLWPDLPAFYHCTNGAELTHGGVVALRILPMDALQPLDWGELPEARNSRGPGGRIWHRFAELPDGSWLAINLDPNVSLAFRGDPELRQACRDRESFAAICHGFEGTEGRQGRNRVIALSFTELLEGLLNANGKPYWLDPSFKDFGYAERFTRRC